MELALKGQPKFSRLKEDEAGGTPAVRKAPRRSSSYRRRPACLVFGCPSPFRLPRWGMILSVRTTQGRPGPLGGGLPWAIFGNAYSVEEKKEQGTKELFVRKGGRIFSAIALQKRLEIETGTGRR